MTTMYRVLARRLLSVLGGVAVCSAWTAAADTELQWTGSAGNGYIDDVGNWGGTHAPIYDAGSSDRYYGNFKGKTGNTLNIGVSADVRLDRLYFQNTQNATFNFDFTGHTVSFQGSQNYPFTVHGSCAGTAYNFLGGTFAFDGQRKTISFLSPSSVTIGSSAVLTGSPDFLFQASSSPSVFTIESGHQGRAFVNAAAGVDVVVKGADRSTCITNWDASAWKLSGGLDFGSARLGGSGGIWTGYNSYGHRQSISNALIDVSGLQGHGYSEAASNNVLRIFGGTEYVLAVPSGSVKYAFAAGYFGCSNMVEVSGAATRMSLSSSDWSFAGISCGVMGDRNILHITDGARVDIGGTSMMIGNPMGMMDRGRSVGNRILVDGGARVSCGRVWVGCAANRSNRYDGTDNTHTYNRNADGTLTKDTDMSIAGRSNVVVFSGHATTGVVGSVYISAGNTYPASLPTATDANGVEIRDGATVVTSDRVTVGDRGEGNYLTIANGGRLETDTVSFGPGSILNFEVTDGMPTDSAIRTRNAGSNLSVSGTPKVVIDISGLTSSRVQTLVAAQSGRQIVLDEGALEAMNASLQVKGDGSARLMLADGNSRLVAKVGIFGLSISVR